ncbi:MAG: hypothetical protein CMO80_03445 [Verrucomicrobiales bacterium]|nr:hypothetical protein [Verrucomicrobiales bacterium]|tara:strand:+ start:5517 stop:5990 length:474 start_codon:yes stop_codon:yes gene_type:complete
MGLFSKSDPIDDHSRELERELENLREEIRQAEADAPKFRSTVTPQQPGEQTTQADPIFEEYDQSKVRQPESPLREDGEAVSSRERGVRAWFRQLKKNVGAAPSTNPRLVKLMSVGNIEGLKPLRAEKRQARNRFLFLFGVLLFVLYVLFSLVTANYY